MREQAESPKQESQPDYEALRDRYLASLKLGKQSPEYKKAVKHLEAFVKFIEQE